MWFIRHNIINNNGLLPFCTFCRQHFHQVLPLDKFARRERVSSNNNGLLLVLLLLLLFC
jgi:hypothetical protein